MKVHNGSIERQAATSPRSRRAQRKGNRCNKLGGFWSASCRGGRAGERHVYLLILGIRRDRCAAAFLDQPLDTTVIAAIAAGRRHLVYRYHSAANAVHEDPRTNRPDGDIEAGQRPQRCAVRYRGSVGSGSDRMTSNGALLYVVATRQSPQGSSTPRQRSCFLRQIPTKNEDPEEGREPML